MKHDDRAKKNDQVGEGVGGAERERGEKSTKQNNNKQQSVMIEKKVLLRLAAPCVSLSCWE